MQEIGRLYKSGYCPIATFWHYLYEFSYEMFKLEPERFYAERRGRIIKFKHDDSEPFKIIEKGLENLESQSNGLLTP